MPKRLVDTELWNNEDIIETFTAEDRYFWLYLLTNPHNSICGVMKASCALISRDMGYSKECVQNLLYRFEHVHNAILVDKETKELFILNWWKFNWTKSPKIISFIQKEITNIKSDNIKKLILERVKQLYRTDTVSIGYAYPPNSIPITNPIKTNKDRHITIQEQEAQHIIDSSVLEDDELPDWIKIDRL